MSNYTILPFLNLLLIRLNEEIEDFQVKELINKTLNFISNKTIDGIIIDVSGIDVIDSFLATQINDLASTVKILNVHSVLVGLSPPVVQTLIDFEINFTDIEFSLTLEDAILKIYNLKIKNNNQK